MAEVEFCGVSRRFGGLHAVINPAGILRDGMFHKMPDEDWDKVIEVHLRGAYNVTRATVEHFRDQQDGSYVHFTSTSGHVLAQLNLGKIHLRGGGCIREEDAKRWLQSAAVQGNQEATWLLNQLVERQQSG